MRFAPFAEAKDSLGHGAAARALGEVALERRDHDRAFELLSDAAEKHVSVRYLGGLLAVIDAYARLFADVDQLETAIRLWSAYDQAREETGRALDQPQEAAARQAALGAARAALGEDGYRRAVAEGKS